MFLKTIYSTLITLLFLTGSLFAQDVTLTIQGTPQMKIDGDSNVRSWDADVKTVDGKLVLTDVENLSLDTMTKESFKEMTFTMPVESIDSGTRGLTRNIHNYLKEDDHPNITFKLNRVTDIQKENGSAKITAEGVINAAGKDHNVTMNVTARMNNDGSVNFSGEQTLLMTSFDIDPPTAVMGTVRARDEFKVIYSVNFR
jgi:polyisoprenoid-binding protein YceI